MKSPYEPLLPYSFGDTLPPKELVQGNYDALLDQLGQTLECPPVLTPEICRRLGSEAYQWAVKGVDLTGILPIDEDTSLDESSQEQPEFDDRVFRELAQRNLVVLRSLSALWKHAKTDGPNENLPHIHDDEMLVRQALFLASQGVDLSDASDVGLDGPDTTID